MKLFRAAEDHAPNSVFIDEIAAIGMSGTYYKICSHSSPRLKVWLNGLPLAVASRSMSTIKTARLC